MEVGQTMRSKIDRPLYKADNKFIAVSYLKETKQKNFDVNSTQSCVCCSLWLLCNTHSQYRWSQVFILRFCSYVVVFCSGWVATPLLRRVVKLSFVLHLVEMTVFGWFDNYVWESKFNDLRLGAREMTEFELEDGTLGSETTGGFSDKYEVKEKLGA